MSKAACTSCRGERGGEKNKEEQEEGEENLQEQNVEARGHLEEPGQDQRRLGRRLGVPLALPGSRLQVRDLRLEAVVPQLLLNLPVEEWRRIGRRSYSGGGRGGEGGEEEGEGGREEERRDLSRANSRSWRRSLL